MNNNIMKLNNEIAQKKLHHEELMIQLNKMKLDNQDAGHRQREKTRFFARVVMAI